MSLPSDVPAIIVLLHLAMLAAVLLRIIVTRYRRAAVVRRSHNRPRPAWLLLLHALLGLPRT